MTPKPLFLSLFLLLASCAAVVAGTPVLAYDEQTGKNEYRPVLEQITQGVAEKRVTYLTLKDDETGLTETLTTTFGHPFYLVKNVDGTNRPAPEGHEDLALPWVGAGDLKVGDKVRQADGTTGSVTRVQNTLETRQMYNLDVAVADTFYVGEGRWLVHNCNNVLNANGVPYPVIYDPRTNRPIAFPPVGESLTWVPKEQRVPWTNMERAEFIAEWHRRGFPKPEGGWDKYDIHHIRPREYGGTNDFENLVPVRRDIHQQLLNPWWQGYK